MVTKEDGDGQQTAERTPPDSDVNTLAAGEELPERWSIQRKTELILRLLRGEGLDAVSRESQVPGPRARGVEARLPGPAGGACARAPSPRSGS
jgi:hypothetical protein